MTKVTYTPLIVIPPDISQSAITMVRRIARAFHLHEIPITWALHAHFPRLMALDINRWHDRFGDEVIMMIELEPIMDPNLNPLDPRSVAEESVRLRELLPKLLAEGRRRLQGEMPWAEVEIAGAGLKRAELLFALRETGFIGLWGYDHLSEGDEPAPFGPFLISEDSHVSTYPPSSKPILGLPRSSLQLNALIRRKLPGDPLSQCLWALDQHVKSARWNAFMPFIHQLDIEEYGEIATDYAEDLEIFLGELKDREVDFVTLPKIASDVQLNPEMASTIYLLAEEEREDRKTLFYHDSSCKMRFEGGEITPVEIRDYTTPYNRSHTDFLCRRKPELMRFLTGREREKLVMLIEVKSEGKIPYALAVWGDFRGLKVKETNVGEVSFLGEHLLFLRISLTPGVSSFKVVLSI
ncbi:TPA: hypothetical protein EYP37_09595 [Candidatus Poribacteria bacterium]|nr:hypothetical protein [Candidatus Poribacteria bacterium]